MHEVKGFVNLVERQRVSHKLVHHQLLVHVVFHQFRDTLNTLPACNDLDTETFLWIQLSIYNQNYDTYDADANNTKDANDTIPLFTDEAAFVFLVISDMLTLKWVHAYVSQSRFTSLYEKTIFDVFLSNNS